MNDPLPPNPASVSPAEEPDDLPAMLLGAALIVVVAFIPYVRMACCLPYLLIGVASVAVIAAISGVLGGSLGALLFRRGPKTKEEAKG